MKKILYAVMLLLGLSILSSCNKEQANRNDYSKLIVGEWQRTHWEQIKDGKVIEKIEDWRDLTFSNDGTCSSLGIKYQYSITGNTLFLAGIGFDIQKLSSDELIYDEASLYEEKYDLIRYYHKKKK